MSGSTSIVFNTHKILHSIFTAWERNKNLDMSSVCRMQDEDKENCDPLRNRANIPRKSNFGKPRGFCALLESAAKENEQDLNFSYAVKTQCQDINCMVDRLVKDFRQEDKDSRFAKDLYESELAAEKMRAEQKLLRESKDERTAKEIYMDDLEQQKKLKKQQQEAQHKDEAAALSVAMQERRDMQKRAETKRALEAKDCDYAKQTILDEMEEQQALEEKCSHDADVAFKLRQQLEDEEFAERLQESVDKETREEAARMAAKDWELAKEIECNLRLHEDANNKEQLYKDRKLACKLLTKSAREAYERKFSLKAKERTDDFSMSAIAAQWENADVDFDDVSGGICITLLLPHLADLKVNLVKPHIISIEANRMVMTGDVHANKKNTFYAAEFEIRGKKIKLTNSDINYNYTSETGLLHIYVENVSLAGMAGEESKSVLKGMKNSFARFFS